MHRGGRLFIFGLACIGGGVTSVAHAQADWRFAHPNADMRISVNLQAVLKSPTITAMVKKAEEGPQDQSAQVHFVLGLLSSIDRVSISARQTSSASLASKDSDALVLVTGSFDPSSIRSMFPSTGAGQVKQVGPHAILIGQGASFTQAVQRMAGPALARPSDELEQSDIWIAGSSALLSQPTSQTVPPAFKAMRGFSLGMNLGESPEASMILTATTPAAATQMLTAFQEMVGPLRGTPQAATFLENALQMKQDGAKVRLHFLAPPELMRMAQAQAASGSFVEQLQPLMGMLGLPGSSGAATPAKTPAPPSNGGKIMIYGLDDGPHEVKTK
jgi:hypothetical protein